MNFTTLIKIAIFLVVAFFGIEALRVRHADQTLQRYAGAGAAFPASDGPVQGAASGQGFEFRGYQVKPLASFAVRARVLAREDYRLGREADLSPVDLALGWKRMADPKVYGPLNITQGGRWYRYSWRDQPPIPLQEIVESSANMHMIPANAAVERTLKQVKEGSYVRITGQLVQVSHASGWTWTSSLTRSDSGANSCELVFVESVQLEP
ncbi:hypothetical protein [Acidovorax sp. RAC01]|mgnify:CR=1 FL=1|uniref:hypothetical protein n=1 Tax=Acidovorax sp. RAC01 TaxID=1842533 RepID=UPI00083E9010|nr:hypothetical protein [Acidovorax sp. RAC01]AOG25241.1 hypothetical protein BSY15_3682 [Acidovorax sp. RAC01]